MNLTDPDIRRLFEYCAARSRHRERTLVRFIQMEMQRKQGILTPLSKLVNAFQELESFGIVELVGTGPNTQVRWNRSIIDVGREALAGRLASEQRINVTCTSESSKRLHIDFPRDSGSVLGLDLPSDLSTSEASRLAEMVRALGRQTAS